MRKIKGISPIVATIILVALTIAIAGILGLWAASYVAQQTTEINQTQEVIKINCHLMKFSIKSCFKETNNKIRLVISNDGRVDINGFIITFFEIEDENIKNLDSKQIDKTIKIGMYEILELQTILQKFDKILIRSLQCPEIEKEEYCH